jgi:Flp pilus assembly protein TadB
VTFAELGRQIGRSASVRERGRVTSSDVRGQDRHQDEPDTVAYTTAGAADGGLAKDVVLYTLARLGLIAAVAAVLVVVRVPLLVALAVAVVVALPLSMVLLRGLRTRVGAGLARRSARRSEVRRQLRAQLRGD